MKNEKLNCLREKYCMALPTDLIPKKEVQLLKPYLPHEKLLVKKRKYYRFLTHHDKLWTFPADLLGTLISYRLDKVSYDEIKPIVADEILYLNGLIEDADFSLNPMFN